jgi:chromosome segregation ATPase
MFGLINKASSRVAVSGSRHDHGAPARVIQMPEPPESNLRLILERVHMSADELDTVGRDNESIRNRCLDIVSKVNIAATLGDDLQAAFAQVDVVMRELERTKAELIQRSVIFNMEADAHAELKALHKSVHDENESHKSANEVLRVEVANLRAATEAAEARIETLESDERELSTLLAATEQQRQEFHQRLTYLREEMQAAGDRIKESDALISSLQSDLGAERHRHALAQQNNVSLQSSLADAQAHAARLRTDLEDAKIGWENSRQQILARDAEIEKLQGEHARMRSLWQQATDAHTSDVSALQSQLDAAAARGDLSERLLGESRDEVQARTDELRQEQRRAQDALARIGVLEQKLQTAETLNAEQVERMAELEKGQGALLQRIKPLLKVIAEKDAEMGKAQQQIDSLQMRLAGDAERAAAERDRAEQTIKTLTENLEKEKILKALAEGALEADRNERIQLHHALHSAKNAQANAQSNAQANGQSGGYLNGQSAA